jgi:uncharacterized protein
MRILFLLVFLSLASPALAQLEGPVLPGVVGEQQVQNNILVIGDVLAGGLGAGLTRITAQDPTVAVTNRFNESSGLARPEFYDWAATIPKITEGKQFSEVVVLIGSNDRREFRSGDFRFPFGTAEWTAAYLKQINAVLDALLAAKLRIYWVSVPPMADQSYDADVKLLSALQQQAVVAKGGTYVDIRSHLLTPQGAYTDRGIDDTGVVRKLRGRDGITFFKQGNNRIAQLVLAAIRKNADLAKPAAGAAVAAPVDDGPVFAEATPDGGSRLVKSSELAFATQTDGNATVSGAVADAPRAGSAAEKLLTTGETLAAPKGRFDDFSVEAAAP